MKDKPSKRIRVKRKGGDESPISSLMQSYVAAVVKGAIDDLDLGFLREQLHTQHVEIRIIYCILADLQTSANLAASTTGSSRETMREFMENVQASLGHNFGILNEIQRIGMGEIDSRTINPQLSPALSEDENISDASIRAVFEDLRARAAHTRGSEGEEFDEEDDMIASAMEDVDGLVDMGDEDDVRGTGGTRQSQRRRRPT
jgi:hypothetical protein